MEGREVYLGGGWVKAEGDAVEMRAVNSLSVGLQLCLGFFVLFLNSIRQLPFLQASL